MRRLCTLPLLATLLAIAGCDSSRTTRPHVPSLVVTDLVVGTGEIATTGDTLVTDYVGRFPDSTKFDSSIDRGQPFLFVLGASQVIKGWDQGLQGAREGGVRRLVIPPNLAYGASGLGPVPPNATVVFDVQLLDVRPAPN